MEESICGGYGMPIRGARIYQWRRECWAFLDHRTTALLNLEAKLKSNSKNAPHFSSNQTGSPVQPAAYLLLIFFRSSAGFRGDPAPLAFLFDSFSFSTCHIEPTHSTLSPHRAQHAKQQLYHIPTALSPRTLRTSCTSCLEQPVLYRFTSLHCMSPSSVQRVHPSVCAHAPFMPFLSSLLTWAVNAPYLSSISLHLRVAPSCHPPIHHRHNAYAVILRDLLGPDAVSLSVTLLPRLFGSSVSYPPFYSMPQHTHVLHLHTAYRT